MEGRKVPKIRFRGVADEWEQRKFAEIVTFFNGLTYTPGDVREIGTFVLRSSNVSDGKIVDADNIYVNPEVVNCENVKPGDIVIVVRNGSRSLIGKHAEIKSFMPNTVIGAFITGIRSQYPSFVNALLSTPQFEKEIEMNMGATINQITGYMFSKMKFFVPSDVEKEIIGECFRQIDNILALYQSKVEKLKLFKEAMLDKMFPKNGRKIPEVRFKGFTGDWEQCKLKDIAYKVTEKNIDFAILEIFTNSAEYGVISQRDFFDHDIAKTENIDRYYVVEEDNFVYNPRISIAAPVGPINRNKLGRKGVISPLYTVFKTHDIDNTFLEYFFKGNTWHPYMYFNGDTGARFDRFSIKNEVFFDMPILYPKLEEQRLISRYLEQLDNLDSFFQRKNEKLQDIKKTMLERMFM